MNATKVWIVSIDEPLFYGRLYSALAASCSDRIDGTIIVRNSDTAHLARLIREIVYRFRFWGIKGFVYAVAASLVSRVFGKGNLPRTCRNLGIPVSHVDTLEEASELLHRENAEIVLCSIPRRVSKECLACVPGGWINTHCGPLPNYRGLDAPFWCLHNDEPNLAVTLHYMVEDFDRGPVVAQRKIANLGEPYFTIMRKLFALALEMHMEFARTRRPTFDEATPQNLFEGSYHGRPDASLGKEFRQRGGRFV